MGQTWQKALAVSFWALALGIYAFYSYQHGLGPMETLRKLSDFMRSSAWGPLVYIGLYTVRPLFLFSAAVLTIGGGAFFGAVWGTVYTVVGSNASAAVAYLMGRFLGRGLLEQSPGEGRLSGYIQNLRENSFETVFLMRLAFLPFDLVNYLAGFLRIAFWPFLLATVLGSLPGTLSFVLFGASSGLSAGRPDFDWRVLAASLAIFGISVGISRWVKKGGRGKVGQA